MFAVHREKKIFVPAFLRSLMITYLITLSLEKEIIVLEKSLEKSPDFWTQKSVRTLYTVQLIVCRYQISMIDTLFI